MEIFKKRLSAVEAKMAQEQLILPEDRLKALERKKRHCILWKGLCKTNA
jgi:hypothetical protein